MTFRIKFISLSLTIFFTLFAALPASATWPLQCMKAIKVYTEYIENDCEGTVTASFSYYNPNIEYWKFNWKKWKWELHDCPDIEIPVGWHEPGCEKIPPFWGNVMSPEEDQGQPTVFYPGFHEDVFQVEFPANGVPREWTLRWAWKTRHTEADPLDAPQDCPVVPEVNCIEAVPGGTFRAEFRVKNGNTKAVTIPTGSKNGFKNISNHQGQPETFAPWPGITFFDLEWDGTDTRWKIKYIDTETAPKDTDINLAYYNEQDASGNFVNRCEHKPIDPKTNCVFDNGDGTFTAWFGYKSQRHGMSHIDVGEQLHGGNEFVSPVDPDHPVSIAADQGQGEDFVGGTFNGTVSVTWDPLVYGEEIRWWLYYETANPFSAAVAYSDWTNPDFSGYCAPVSPYVCTHQSLAGNQNGYLTAWFSYSNNNNFEITSEVNTLTPGFVPTPGIPTTFVPGGKQHVFEVDFQDDQEVVWTVGAKEAKAFMHGRPCEPNEAPSCEILGNTELGCGGVETLATLNAAGSDPEGRKVSYEWLVDCGENSSYVVSGEENDVLSLTLLEPGFGNAVGGAFGLPCEVTLQVSDDFDMTSCSTKISATACEIDCEGAPYVPGQEHPEWDECGVCGGDNSTCADCAGVPNGNHVYDEQADPVCCLPEEIDDCYVCNGDNSSCADCAGTPNGVAVTDLNGACCLEGDKDTCGICFGDGKSCLDFMCITTSVANEHDALRKNNKAQWRVLKKQTNKLKKNAKNKKKTKKLRKDGKEAVDENSELLDSLQTSVTTCENNDDCINTNNSEQTEKYKNNAKKIMRNTKDAINARWNSSKGGKCNPDKGGAKQCLKRLKKRLRDRNRDLKNATKLYEDILNNISVYPDVTSNCGV